MHAKSTIKHLWIHTTVSRTITLMCHRKAYINKIRARSTASWCACVCGAGFARASAAAAIVIASQELTALARKRDASSSCTCARPHSPVCRAKCERTHVNAWVSCECVWGHARANAPASVQAFAWEPRTPSVRVCTAERRVKVPLTPGHPHRKTAAAPSQQQRRAYICDTI